LTNGLPVTRRIARAIFAGVGAIAVLLSFAPFAADPDARYLLVHRNWRDVEFRSLLEGVFGSFVAGCLLLACALLISKAKSPVLLGLIAVNVFLLYWSWQADAKEAVLIPPFFVSLVCLVFEEKKLLRSPLGQRT